MSRPNSRTSGIVRLTAVALSLTVFVGIGWGETSSAEDQQQRIIATDYSSIQEAIDSARELGILHIYIPAGKYEIAKTLNLTGFHGGTIEGAGCYTTIIQAATGSTPGMDLTNSSSMVLKNFQLADATSGEQRADVGILMRGKSPGQSSEQSIISSGNHKVHNVRVTGFSKAAVLVSDSEPNYFYTCFFASGGAAVVITDYDREGVTSSDMAIEGSANNTTYFYGTIFIAAGPDAAGLRISGATSVFIEGGFVNNTGSFAGIYLDGTGHLGQVTIRDVHMEGATQHNIYAVGAVRNVIIEGAYWDISGSETANIRHQERIPGRDAPHQYVAFPEASGRAENWNIRNVLLVRAAGGAPTGPRIRFDGLQDSRISNIHYLVSLSDIKTLVPHIVIEKYSRRNVFEVPSREAVELRGDAQGNTIVALCDDSEDKIPLLWQSGWTDAPGGGPNGVRWMGLYAMARQKYYDGTRRTYIKPDAGLSLLNLGVVNVFEIEKSRKGDFVLHDGTGFEDSEPRLAVFNGDQWLFFRISASPQQAKEQAP